MTSTLSQELLNICVSAQHILLTGPVGPDGDSIGACIALQHLLRQHTSAQIDITGKIDFQYKWMSGVDSWKDDLHFDTAYDLVIVVDGDCFRLPPVVKELFDRATHTVLIDHHSTTDVTPYTIAILDKQAESTCSMVYKLAVDWGCTITKDIAASLYTGIIFDTGGFQHNNTTAQTHRIVAELMETGFDANAVFVSTLVEKKPSGLRLLEYVLANTQILAEGKVQMASISNQTLEKLQCSSGDLEGLVNTLLYVQGVELSCLLTERSEKSSKVSLRSRNHVNCATLAKQISAQGGGHIRAAGATVCSNLTEAIPHVQKAIIHAMQKK
jgi:phosphoesterase RecJ-like protein